MCACVCFAVNQLSFPKHTALLTLTINDTKYESWNLNHVMLPGYRDSKRCHFPFVSANEQRGTLTAAAGQGQMRPSDNIIKWNVSLFWTIAGAGVGKVVFLFLCRKYFQISQVINWSCLERKLIRLWTSWDQIQLHVIQNQSTVEQNYFERISKTAFLLSLYFYTAKRAWCFILTYRVFHFVRLNTEEPRTGSLKHNKNFHWGIIGT